MRYSILLADADGTLFDFHAGERKALTVTMNTLGMAVNDDLVALYSRVNLSHWLRLERGETTQARLRVERFADYWRELRALGVAVPDVPPENVSELFVEALSAQRIPMPGAEALLKSVSAQMPVYLVTNGIARVQRARFEQSELRLYMTDILISEELGHAKPDPFMLLEAMRRAGVTDPRRAVMLGDSVSADIGAATLAQVDSVLFTNGKPAPESHGATFVAPTLADAAQKVLAQA